MCAPGHVARAAAAEIPSGIADQALAADGPGAKYGPNGKVEKVGSAARLPLPCGVTTTEQALAGGYLSPHQTGSAPTRKY